MRCVVMGEVMSSVLASWDYNGNGSLHSIWKCGTEAYGRGWNGVSFGVWCGQVLWALDVQADGAPWTGAVREDLLTEVLCLHPSRHLCLFIFCPFLSLSYLGTMFICSSSLQPQCFLFYSFVIKPESRGCSTEEIKISPANCVSFLKGMGDSLSLWSTLGRRDNIGSSSSFPMNTKRENK